MSDPSPPLNSAEAERPFDALSQRFNAALQAGQPLRIEEFLSALSEPERAALVRRVLLLEAKDLAAYLEPSSEQAPLISTVRSQVTPAGEPPASALQSTVDAPTPPRPLSSTISDPARPVWERSTLPQDAPSSGRASAQATLDDYQLLRVLGKGGMGVVYRARQRSANRIVALKVIRSDRLADLSEEDRREWLDRFRTEAQAAARIEHENVVPVYDVGEEAGQPYYAMRFIEGKSLAELCRDGPLESRRSAKYLEPVARALHAAHAQGIVHRDLKPRNILVDTADHPWVTDFGLAKLFERDGALTQTGRWLGTPPYMSPEQARDATRVGPGSDVYSLGATLYDLLTGRPPFQSADPVETLRQVREEDPVPVRRLNPAVPRDLETIALKCLQKESARRYATAAALADDLRRFLAGEPIEARPIGWMERLGKWIRRRPAAAALVAVIGVALLATLTGILWHSSRLQKEVDRADSERDRAIHEQGIATTLRAEAEGRELATRRHAYASDMKLAFQASEVAHLARMRELLESWRPSSAQPHDLRSFEWYHLWRLCHSEQQTLGQFSSRVTCLAVSPDGKSVAAGYSHVAAPPDRTVRIWNLTTGQAEIVLAIEGQGGASAVAFAPNGLMLATASPDGTVKLWDLAKRQVQAAFRDPGRGVRGLAFAPSGQTLAVASGDGNVRLWDFTNDKVIATWGKLQQQVASLAYSPDGKTLAFGSFLAEGRQRTGVIKLWDTASGQERATLLGHGDEIKSLAFTPDGKTLASGSGDSLRDQEVGEIILWDAVSGERRATLLGHRGAVLALAFAPHGKTLASAGVDSTRLWNGETGELQSIRKGHTDRVSGIGYAQDGQTLVSCSWDGTLKVWDAVNGPERPPLKGHTGWVRSLDLTRDGKLLATGGADGSVKLWNAQTGEELRDLKQKSGVTWVQFAPDGLTVAAAYVDHTLRLYDVTGTLEPKVLQGHTGPILCMAYAPDGKMLASLGSDDTLRLWDLATGQAKVLPLKAPRSLAFAPNGHLLVTGSHDGTVRLWNLAKLEEPIVTTKGHEMEIRAVAFAPNGQSFATGSDDTTVKIWDTATGKERGKLVGHRKQVRAIAYAPDGKTLATGSWDGTVRLWDIETGRERISIQPPGQAIGCLAFAAEGGRLAAGRADGIILCWDAARN